MNRFSMTAVLVLLTGYSLCTASPEVDAAVQKAKNNIKALEGKYVEIHYDSKYLTFHSKDEVIIGDDGKPCVELNSFMINNKPARAPVQNLEQYDQPCRVADQKVIVSFFDEKISIESFNQKVGTKIVYNGKESLIQSTSVTVKTGRARISESVEEGKANIPVHFSLEEYYRKCAYLIGEDKMEPKVENGKLVSLSPNHDDYYFDVSIEDPSNGTINSFTYPMSILKRVETYEDFITIGELSAPSKYTLSEYDENGKLNFIQSYSNITYKILAAPDSPDTFAITKTEGAKPLSGAHQLLLPASK